jgi:hypothetical protein
MSLEQYNPIEESIINNELASLKKEIIQDVEVDEKIINNS